MNAHAARNYLPAAGRDWALPLYDPLVKVIGGDATRKKLIDQASLTAGQRALEVGCGTGSLLIQMACRHRDVEVTGLDPDPKALARAEAKAARAGVGIHLERGFADRLPWGDGSFDHVFSSFMFHHLPQDEREPALREARRVLEPSGRLHLLDFGGHEDAHGWLGRRLHHNHHLRNNDTSRLLTMMGRAGFAEARQVAQGRILFGMVRINYYEARW